MLRIYDGNNSFRRALETSTTGLTVREVFNEVQNTDDVCIYVWDGFNANARRRARYPLYKMHRPAVREDIYQSMTLCKEVMKLSKAISIEVPEYEGDDVVATLVKTYTQLPRVIYSTDRDFQQLMQLPNVTQPWSNPKIEPRYVRLYKTLVGDRSDNIKGVPGFGHKAWEAHDKEQLLRWAEAGFDPDETPLYSAGWKRWVNTHRDTLQAMWSIIGFFDVPQEVIAEHTVMGRNRPDVANEILNEFLQ